MSAYVSQLLEDGVYLGLDDHRYFPQGLGSSDLIRLHFDKEGWWWASNHNPDKVDKVTKEQTYGSGLHAILLEGEAAYESRFASTPERPGGAVSTIGEIKQALEDGGFSLKGTSGWNADDWHAAMRRNLPDRPCWPNILGDFEIERGNKRVISAIEDRMLRFMRDVAMSPDRADNAEIRHLFNDGAGKPPLAEVSILYTMPCGIRRRWRIDRMFPRFDLDLKSLGNWYGRPLEYATGDQIARSGYDIQRADYYEGRTRAYEFIRAGKVFGGSLEQRQWLFGFPDNYLDWDWVWLFYQKPDPKGRAPVIFPIMDITWQAGFEQVPVETWTDSTPGLSIICQAGALKKSRALDLYRRCVGEFGLDKPWARVDQLRYIQEGYGPQIILPHYLASERPSEESAYQPDDGSYAP